MRQFLSEFQKNLMGIWARLDGGQRLVVLTVLAAAMVGLGAILWFAGQPSYVSVFEAQSSEELREAKRALNQAVVPFVPDETGSGLLVDRDNFGEARSALMDGGLLDKGSGSILNSSIVEDADTRRHKLEGATRGQAEDAIAALSGVHSATVTASLPKRNAFVSMDGSSQSQATIALRLRQGASFTDIARSAASLAASQLGLPMANVEVYNAANPSQRWRYDPDMESGGGSSEFLALQRRLASERTQLAQQALDALYPGKTHVQVGVDLDPMWEVTNQKMLPDTPYTLNENTTKDETDSSQRGKTGGDPSLVAQAANEPSNSNKSVKETKEKTYHGPIGEKRTARLAPEIKRLSVALLYDPSLEQTPGFDKQKLVSVVKSIVGWDPARDDESMFSSMAGAFAPPEALPEAPAPGMGELAAKWGPTIGQVVGVVLVLLFLKSLMKAPAPKAVVVEPTIDPAIAAAAAAEAEAKLPPEEQQKRMRREIERAIAGDPAALAKILEGWLAETRA